MTEQEYFAQRVDDQINWFDKKSGWNKRMFMRMKIIETILALLIPFLTGYITTENVTLKVLVGLIGVVVAVMTGLITLYKLQENWINYRSVGELLKQEKFLFLAKAGPYVVDDAFPIFVERFESLLSKENAQWSAYTKEKKAPAPEKK